VYLVVGARVISGGGVPVFFSFLTRIGTSVGVQHLTFIATPALFDLAGKQVLERASHHENRGFG
jgi:hypothetical protein